MWPAISSVTSLMRCASVGFGGRAAGAPESPLARSQECAPGASPRRGKCEVIGGGAVGGGFVVSSGSAWGTTGAGGGADLDGDAAGRLAASFTESGFALTDGAGLGFAESERIESTCFATVVAVSTPEFERVVPASVPDRERVAT